VEERERERERYRERERQRQRERGGSSWGRGGSKHTPLFASHIDNPSVHAAPVPRSPPSPQIINANGAAATAGPVKVGINGFGRIGRLVLRAAQANPLLQVRFPFVVLNRAVAVMHTSPRAQSSAPGLVLFADVAP